jgi:hypothetical protein
VAGAGFAALGFTLFSTGFFSCASSVTQQNMVKKVAFIIRRLDDPSATELQI